MSAKFFLVFQVYTWNLNHCKVASGDFPSPTPLLLWHKYSFMYVAFSLPIDFCLLITDFQWHPTPVLLPRKSHGLRSLVCCSPWGRWELDTTHWLHFRFSLSCIGEGNGSPLQCSCLENPRDGGAWWAAIYGVAQSRTRLKRLSSSSSSWKIVKDKEVWGATVHEVTNSWTQLSD